MLVCKCGGSLEITSQTYPEDEDGNNIGMALEVYECASCGRTGSFKFGQGQEIMSGCVTCNEIL